MTSPRYRCLTRALPLLLLCGLSLPLLAADAFDELKASADGIVAEFMEEEEVVGVGLALVYPGEAPWSQGYGFSARRPDRPFSAATPNALHELAKPLVAIAVMQLAERGLLELDAPFSRYFPAFRPWTAEGEPNEFTIRQLLSHHSGLPTWFAPASRGQFLAEGSNWKDYRQVLRHSEDLALVATPGQVYHYSYLGYVLLALLVEERSGLAFEDFVAANILTPLGMRGSWYGAVDEPRAGLVLPDGPWQAFEDGRATAHSRFRDLPAAGLVSSAADMARVLQALLNGGGGILGEAALAELFRAQNAGVPEDGNFRMGLGFFLTPVTGGLYRQEASISHAATDGIARSYLLAFPQHGVGVLLTSNTAVNSVALRDSVDRIAERMLASLGLPAAEPFAPHAEVALDVDRARLVEGDYAGPGGSYHVERRRNSLRLDVPQLPFLSVRLLPREEGYFGVDVRFLGFGLGMLGRVRQLAESVEGRLDEVEGRKLLQWYWRGVTAVSLSEIPPAAEGPPLQAWLQRRGTWYSDVTGRGYELRHDARSGQFLYGPDSRGFGGFGEPAELLCVESAEVLRNCARGLLGADSRIVLRWREDSSLLDAQGVGYTRRAR